MSKLCIIAVDYEDHVPRTNLSNLDIEDSIPTGKNVSDIKVTSIHRGLQSLRNQTSNDFDFIICHDGPKKRTYDEEDISLSDIGSSLTVINTPERNNDWGHSSRDFALRYAISNNIGEYYLIFNIDNVLKRDAVSKITEHINSFSDAKVLICPIIQTKIGIFGSKEMFWNPMILTGLPPKYTFIDVMQLIAHRDVWTSVNFWYDKSQASDGYIYENICNKYNYIYMPYIIGHNY